MNDEMYEGSIGDLSQFQKGDWLADARWRAATVNQIEKDFTLQAIPLNLSMIGREDRDFLAEFAMLLEQLNLVHHPRFISLLYQLDLPEERIGSELRNTEAENIYAVLAKAIALQCLKKVWWRARMK